MAMLRVVKELACNFPSRGVVYRCMQPLHNVHIKEDSILAALAARKLCVGQVALTIGNTIHLHNTQRNEFLANQRWVKHELAHVEQFNRYGFWSFMVRYTWESLKVGYYRNKFEVEAREKEEN
jgi:hypothetical protein